MNIPSKLPNVGTTIFTVMSALAQEYKAINLAQGFPDFPSSPLLTDLVYQYMRSGHNQYAPMPGLPALRARIAEKIALLYQASVDPMAEITITAGATQAIFTAIMTFVRAGDEVILLEPAYDSYRPSVEVCGGKAVIYELSFPDYKIDWQALQQLINARTRMIIINTPHNPAGAVWSDSDMKALAQLTAGTDILVLSDEVYEHLVFDGLSHQSVLRYPELRERSLAVYSFGKTFHNTGWKIGYCVAPEKLSAEFRKVHQFNVFSVNTPMQYALADFLSDPSEYLGLSGFYQQKRDFFLKATEGSRLRPLPCHGSYFQLFDYSAVSDESEMQFAQHLTKIHGVAAIPVSAFYSESRDNKVVRLCFAKKEETLERAGEQLRQV